MSTELKILLASASPRRSHLLEEHGYAFDKCPADVDEMNHVDADPKHLVMHNASLKCDHVAKQYPDRLVLGSDTTVALGDMVLNKPKDLEDAYRMLGMLSGQAHTVYTGVVFECKSENYKRTRVVASQVVFKKLKDEDIRHYCSVVNTLDKAGAYGIQEGKELIIDHFEGSFSNIMGLPMETIAEMYAEAKRVLLK